MEGGTKNQEEKTVNNTGHPICDVLTKREFTIEDFSPPVEFLILDESGQEVIRLSWENGTVDVVGNLESGAELFFMHFLKDLVEDYWSYLNREGCCANGG